MNAQRLPNATQSNDPLDQTLECVRIAIRFAAAGPSDQMSCDLIRSNDLARSVSESLDEPDLYRNKRECILDLGMLQL